MVDSRGMKTVSIRLTPKDHKRLKILAVHQEKTIRELLLEWLEEAEKKQMDKEEGPK